MLLLALRMMRRRLLQQRRAQVLRARSKERLRIAAAEAEGTVDPQSARATVIQHVQRETERPLIDGDSIAYDCIRNLLREGVVKISPPQTATARPWGQRQACFRVMMRFSK